MDIEDVDLADLAACLGARFAKSAPAGYLDGLTAFRDAVADELTCSELVAEEIVDTLVGCGFVRYLGDPAEALESGWSLPAPPD